MDFYLIAYFFAGVLQDFLLTLNWRFVAKERLVPATLASFTVTVVSMVVLYTILANLDSNRSLPAILVYSLGVAAGTVLGMKMKIGGKGF